MTLAHQRGTRPAITAVVLCATVYTAVQGLTYPLLSLILERQGASSLFIGLNAAMMPLGMVAALAVGPLLVRRLGSLHLLLSSLLTAAAFLILLKVTAAVPLMWFPVRFVLGLAIAGVFVVTDVWINRLASDDTRGRMLGVYGAGVALGFAAGPALLALIGSSGWLPFVLPCMFIIAAAVPPAVIHASLPDDHTQSRPVEFLTAVKS